MQMETQLTERAPYIEEIVPLFHVLNTGHVIESCVCLNTPCTNLTIVSTLQLLILFSVCVSRVN